MSPLLATWLEGVIVEVVSEPVESCATNGQHSQVRQRELAVTYAKGYREVVSRREKSSRIRIVVSVEWSAQSQTG